MSLRSFYSQRSVLYALVVSNFKGQYNNSKLGVLWQFISPIIIVLLFYVVFTSIRISEVNNLWLMLCAGIFPYTFMESAIVSGSMCLVNNGYMLKKMQFPRIFIVVAHIVTSLITFTIILLFVIAIALLSGCYISATHLIELVPLTFITFIFNIGLAAILSSVVVYYRDLGHFIGATSRLLFWMSPTIYTIQDVSGLLERIMSLNPLTYYISNYHQLIYYNAPLSLLSFCLCVVMSVFVLCVGLMLFKKLEGGFAERL